MAEQGPTEPVDPPLPPGFRRFYAKLDHVMGEQRDGIALFDCVDQGWFQDVGGARGLLTAPSGDEISPYEDEKAHQHVAVVAVAGRQLPEDEQLWHVLTVGPETQDELRSLGDGGLSPETVVQFADLVGPGVTRPFVALRPATRAEAARLGAAGSMKAVPVATPAIVRGLLPAGPIDRIRVFDVGQGNMNALERHGVPQLLFDFGGGVHVNQSTFHPGFAGPSLSASPAVVLSHWDWDHWSSARRFTAAMSLTWLVPDQGSLGPTHAVFLADLRAAGTVYAWRPTLPRAISLGPVELQRAGGSARSRNNSGLALMLARNGHASLLPGDAGYQHLVHPQRLVSLVVAHHGGATRTAAGDVPAADGPLTALLGYSFGPGNSYGHPLTGPEANHAAKWPFDVRTADRVAGPNHLVLPVP